MLPDGKDISERRSKLSPEKKALLDRMLRGEFSQPSELKGISARDGRSEFPLSFAQQRLWFINRLEPDSANYNIPDVYRISGRIDVPVLERVLTEIVRRHEVLRTVFVVKDGDPVQVISPAVPFVLELKELARGEASRRDEEAMRLAAEESARPFDLERGPLFRGRLMTLDAEDHILVLSFHHIVYDGWSTAVFFDEMTRLYDAFIRNQPSPLADLPIQYADYAVWQRKWMQGDILRNQLAYWKDSLAGVSGVLELQTDHPRPAIQTYRGADQELSIPFDLQQDLRQLSVREGATLFMTLAAAFQTLLHRYTGQDDILVGTPIAGRTKSETERLIGFFINTILLRTQFSGNPSFLEVLGRTRQAALGAYQHQDIPFEKLVEELHPQRDPGRTPFFQAMFVLQNAPMGLLNLSGLTLKRVNVENTTAKFDLTVSMIETPKGFQGWINYNSDLFDPPTIRRMATNFEVLLRGIARDPAARVSDLPLLGPEEKEKLLGELSGRPCLKAPDTCIQYLVEEHAGRRPDAPAVISGDETLSYRELNTRANRLAGRLCGMGAGAGSLAGICLERGAEMVVAMLAAQKAGGAYVPLDPAYPRARLEAMIEDAGLAAIVTQESSTANLPVTSVPSVFIDRDREMIAALAGENPPHVTRPSDAAYVIFTSGSTGRPKGVMISHGALVSHAMECGRIYGFRPGDRALQFASVNFDIAVEQIFAPLAAGICVVVRGAEIWTVHEFVRELVKQEITVASLPNAYWRQIVDTLAGGEQDFEGLRLRVMMTGGEQMLTEGVRRWYRSPFRNVRLLNGYGPTETTVMPLAFECSREMAEREGGPPAVPIGRPLRNRVIYVLDRYGNPAPLGAAGELYIGGPTLARGYVNRPELTAEKFISDPFDTDGGGRLYRTGDLVRFGQDGNVMFLGRADEQVKVRGFRIELGEIEEVMKHHPGVRDAVVMARDDGHGDKRIIAYYTSRDTGQDGHQEIRSFLQVRLPDYMVPSAFVALEQFPLTPNGKLDRKALPEPAFERRGPGAEALRPRDALEMRLALIWEHLLGKDQVGIRDNFFDLGGHSLLAVRLFGEVEKLTGKRLPLATLFQAPTIEQLAAILRSQGWEAPWSSLVAIKPEGNRPPLFCAHAVGGNVLTYSILARYLHPEQPLYGIQSVGLDGRQIPETDMVHMASHYVEEIRSLQPHGPYSLGGTCAGGSVALEIAQQLRNQGEQIAFLGMFDAFPQVDLPPMSFRHRLGLKARGYGERIRYHLHNILFGPGRLEYVGRKFRTIRRRLKSRIWQAAFGWFYATHHELPKGLQNVEEANMIAFRKYVPQLYDGKITVFEVEETSVGQSIDSASMWERLAGGGMEVHRVPGDHVNFFSEPNVQVLARELNDCLERTQTGRREGGA